MEKVIGVVMAKSTSLRCPHKNITRIGLHKTPLLVYPIRTLKASKACSTVIVSTDSEQYANIALENGADGVVMRDAGWDNQPYTMFSANQSRRKYERDTGEKYEFMVWMGANTVFVRPSWIRAAIRIIKDYYLDGMPVGMVVNNLVNILIAVSRVVNDDIYYPKSFELLQSGIICDIDHKFELDMASQIMSCIETGAITYDLDEDVHETILTEMNLNHFRGLSLKPGVTTDNSIYPADDCTVDSIPYRKYDNEGD